MRRSGNFVTASRTLCFIGWPYRFSTIAGSLCPVIAQTFSTPDNVLPGDLDGDGIVSITDFLMLLAVWGPCPDPCPPSCIADLDGDCSAGIIDLPTLLAHWT